MASLIGVTCALLIGCQSRTISNKQLPPDETKLEATSPVPVSHGKEITRSGEKIVAEKLNQFAQSRRALAGLSQNEHKSNSRSRLISSSKLCSPAIGMTSSALSPTFLTRFRKAARGPICKQYGPLLSERSALRNKFTNGQRESFWNMATQFWAFLRLIGNQHRRLVLEVGRSELELAAFSASTKLRKLEPS